MKFAFCFLLTFIFISFSPKLELSYRSEGTDKLDQKTSILVCGQASPIEIHRKVKLAPGLLSNQSQNTQTMRVVGSSTIQLNFKYIVSSNFLVSGAHIHHHIAST